MPFPLQPQSAIRAPKRFRSVGHTTHSERSKGRLGFKKTATARFCLHALWAIRPNQQNPPLRPQACHLRRKPSATPFPPHADTQRQVNKPTGHTSAPAQAQKSPPAGTGAPPRQPACTPVEASLHAFRFSPVSGTSRRYASEHQQNIPQAFRHSGPIHPAVRNKPGRSIGTVKVSKRQEAATSPTAPQPVRRSEPKIMSRQARPCGRNAVILSA